MIDIQISRKVFNPAFLPYLEDQHRYMVFYGGAGSGKSYFIAERYIYHILKDKLLNLLVVRAVGRTNRDSTFALFKQVIARWGLSEYFKANESDMRITCILNQNSVLFKGLDDTEKLKSITFAKGELTDIWIEEASETLEADFNQLDVRLRGKGTQKQIVISFNPVDVNHWLKKRFFDRKDDRVTVLHTTYKDNAFLDEDYKKLLESYKETDPYYYDVYCLGQWGVLGSTIFDAQKVNRRLAEIRGLRPKATGYFEYRYDGVKITEIQWVDSPDGCIKIYKPPREGAPYVIGGDTAGEGSDRFIGQVLDNTDGRQAAVLSHQFDEDVYARQIYCLGIYYNTALVGIETNFSTFPVKELERLQYPKQYVRQTEDNYTHKPKDAYGFKTTSTTRPVIIAGLVQVVRESIELMNDPDTLGEMLTFVRNEKGRPEAQQGAHDDHIMALAIAHYIRPQQDYTEREQIKGGVKWTPDQWEDYQGASEAGRAYLIEKWGNPF